MFVCSQIIVPSITVLHSIVSNLTSRSIPREELSDGFIKTINPVLLEKTKAKKDTSISHKDGFNH